MPGFLELELELEPRAWNLEPGTSLSSPAYLDLGNVAFTQGVVCIQSSYGHVACRVGSGCISLHGA